MIKAIVFDCFGVLTTDKWREFADSLPPKSQPDRARELNRQYGAGLLTNAQFLEQISELTGQAPDAIAKLLDNEDNKNTQLLRYIEMLRPDYKIGLLSNVASNWIRDSFLTSDEQKLFDEMVFSYEVRLTKPDPRMFEIICDKLGVEPNAAVMIDDIESYCASAESLGMKSITYKSFAQMRPELERLLKQQ